MRCLTAASLMPGQMSVSMATGRSRNGCKDRRVLLCSLDRTCCTAVWPAAGRDLGRSETWRAQLGKFGSSVRSGAQSAEKVWSAVLSLPNPFHRRSCSPTCPPTTRQRLSTKYRACCSTCKNTGGSLALTLRLPGGRRPVRLHLCQRWHAPAACCRWLGQRSLEA